MSATMVMPLSSNCLGRKSYLSLTAIYRAWGKTEGHVPERFLDKHGSHSTNAQLQEQNFAVFVFQYIARNFFVLFFVFLSLKEIPISSHPRKRLTTAVGAPRNKIRWNLRAISHSVHHISHWLYRIPGVIGTASGHTGRTGDLPGFPPPSPPGRV